jgi:hypothetical protein
MEVPRMTDDLIKAVALAIKAELGKQMNAQPIHPDPAVDDWAATGGEINLSEVARAAIRAAAPLILDMAADHLGKLAYETPLGHENLQRGASTYNWLREHERLIRQLKERFQ